MQNDIRIKFVHICMPPIGGNRPACAIKCTDVSDPSKVYEFGSLLGAKKALMEWQQKNVGHSMLKKLGEQKREAYGFKWELIDYDGMDESHDVEVFTFRECVENIFNGQNVRVTTENPRRASVYDIIRVVMEAGNPHSVFQRLCADYVEVLSKCENFSFIGAGQRETPVADAEGIMYIINLLPGRRATQFRQHAMQLLVRFLAGDSSLHEEIDANARAQAILPENHPMQMMTEMVYSNPKSCKYIFKSPRMKGQFIDHYYGKAVVYLLVLTIDGKTYTKAGWSDDIRSRLDAHFKELGSYELYTIIAMDNAYRLEKAFKERFAPYNEEVVVGGRTRTELFSGPSVEEAEETLVELYHELRIQNASDKQMEFEKVKMENEMKMRLAEMQHQLEMKKLELAILQTQAGLTSNSSRGMP